MLHRHIVIKSQWIWCLQMFNTFISVSCLLIMLNLLLEFLSYVHFIHWLNQNVSRGVTLTFEMPIQESIIFFVFRLICSTIGVAQSVFIAQPVCPKYGTLQYSTFHVRTLIRSSEFQSKYELLITENCLPIAGEVTVDLVLKCLQHLHLLALHLEILGYIQHLLNGLVCFRRI